MAARARRRLPYLRFSTKDARYEVESCTLGTRDRSARNCSCDITSMPMEAEGLRNVTSPGGAGCPLADNPPAPCPAWCAGQEFRTISGGEGGSSKRVARLGLGFSLSHTSCAPS